jgi:hypothetical protein
MSSERGNWGQTFLGVPFYYRDPRPEDVHPEDIAHALALQCRFGGHCSTFYSVAEHSIRVSYEVPPEHALVGLLHDAAEAYVLDLPRPLKRMLGEYAEIERGVAMAVGQRFGVDLTHVPACVKHADEVLLATEKRDLMPNVPQPWPYLPDPLPSPIVPLGWDRAKEAFLRRLQVLSGVSP